jgi:glycosyltransferase involved in cell wall biosynthesis
VVAGGFDGNGGLQRLLRAGLEPLAADVPVTVVTWRARRRPAAARSGALRVVRVPSLGRWDRDRGRLVGMLDTALSTATALGAALLLRRRYATIYAAGLVPEGLVAVLAGRLLGRRVVLGTWSCGEIGNVARLLRSPFSGFESRLLRRASAVIAESEQMGEELERAGFPASRIHVVPAGVPIRPAARRDRSALPVELRNVAGVVVAASRFDLRQKRLDLLVEGWRRAALEGWRLLLVGEGPDDREVRALAASLSPPALVLGWQDTLAPLYAAADAFALATEGEGTGLVVLEGMAAGRPGLVSDAPPFDRTRPDGVTLVANDAPAWAAALRELAGAADREERGRRARAWVEAHGDIASTVAAYRDLLGAP